MVLNPYGNKLSKIIENKQESKKTAAYSREPEIGYMDVFVYACQSIPEQGKTNLAKGYSIPVMNIY